jgi:Mn2+/Fe2+ NRAMP family transporter
VLNGVVAVPVMAAMMMLVTRFSVMGRFTAHGWLIGLGWTGTALMAVTVAALSLSYFA